MWDMGRDEGFGKGSGRPLRGPQRGAGRGGRGNGRGWSGKITEGKKRGKWVWELPERGGLNRDIEVTVRIPAYLVAGLMKESRREPIDWVVREAVKEYLVKRGQTWWQPRFMAVLRAQEIEAANRQVSARNRFTRRKGL